MIRTRGANRTLHRIIRGIVLLNFILLVVDSNALPSFQDLIRRNQFVTPLSYWVEISTLSVIGLLLVQPILRAYQRAKTPKDSLTLIDKAFLADLLLLLLWITALFVAAARSGAGASGYSYPGLKRSLFSPVRVGSQVVQYCK